MHDHTKALFRKELLDTRNGGVLWQRHLPMMPCSVPAGTPGVSRSPDSRCSPATHESDTIVAYLICAPLSGSRVPAQRSSPRITTALFEVNAAGSTLIALDHRVEATVDPADPTLAWVRPTAALTGQTFGHQPTEARYPPR